MTKNDKPTKEQPNPNLFISYSWSSLEHEQWVLELATELAGNGVDVILDKWDLKEGQDAYAFMERMVTDSKVKKVAIILDKVYVEKANERKAGVGTETQIISSEIYEKTDQSKFVAIISEKDEAGKPYLPIYYKSRVYIDLSSSDLYASNYEKLLRWIYDKPLHTKPDIGQKPAFLSDENQILLGTTIKYRKALEAIRNNREYAKGALEDYFTTFVAELEKFRIADLGEGEFDDHVIENIGKFIPFRNEAIEIFSSIAQYQDSKVTAQQVHKYFEKLIPYTDNPESVTTYKRWDFDNFRFIILELFLYAITCLLKYENFELASYLLHSDYYVERFGDYGKNVMVNYTIFQQPMFSFDYRNKRLELRRLSLEADLLRNRSDNTGITFRQLMQTDFILFLKDSIDAMQEENRYQNWYPCTLVYAGHLSSPFELFARAQSTRYFGKIRLLLGIDRKEDFATLFESFGTGKLHVPRWGFTSINPKMLAGFDKLETKS